MSYNSYDMSSSDEWEQGNAGDREAESHDRWRVIEQDELRRCQNEATSSVQETLNCSRSQALVLLRHHRWKRDKLLDAIGEAGQELVFRDAGAQVSAAGRGAGAPAAGFNTGSCACMICMEEQTCASTMECGHTFCNVCWRQHLITQISEGTGCGIRCMAFKCNIVCNDNIVQALLRDGAPRMLAKYEHTKLNSFIEDNAMVKWCPSVPCCGRAAEALDDEYCEPMCPCGEHFCFKCSAGAHSPSTCEMWQTWKEKEEGESETKNWLQANTKPCPKCAVPVEKDGGCNLVVCRSCRQSFCWLCGAKTGVSHTWEVIDGHTCGEWRDDLDRGIQESKRKLERYLHYYKHYSGHRASAEQERETYAFADMIPEIVSGCVSELVDFSFLENGARVLSETRRVLANSYVLAYFIFGNDMYADDISATDSKMLQGLFEDTQQTLTAAAEVLSRHLHNVQRDFAMRLQSLQAKKDGESGATTSADTAAALQAGKRQKVETSPEQDQQARLDIINHTNNIDARLSRLFDLIENEVLARVHSRSSQIAPRIALVRMNQ